VSCDLNTPYLDAHLDQDCFTVFDKYFGIHGASYSSYKREARDSGIRICYFHCLEIPFFPENFYEMATYTNILTSESIFLVQYKASVF
jgi:hypothetical protein